ncbi:MAG: LysR substrate-binding domain-containing protein [Marivibrio sp.]|uniref:LysR substrate-binding domain-containing protein n=1 Tax=Marivibrio sp. TaxID=2039719 RepID=UPI0032ECAC53
MNLRDLDYLVAVAELEHFGRASERCHVSQPTLSAQIKKLEGELGVTLFERTNKSVRATPVGREIAAIARRALEAAEDIRRAAAAHRDPLAGAARLGAIPTIAPWLVPAILPAIQRELPTLDLALVEEMTAPLTERLLAGDLDAALIATAPESSRLEEIPLFDEPFWLVAPRGHPLAEAPSVSAAAIDPEELLLLSEGHCFRDQALSFCRAARPDRRVKTDLRATSFETVLNLVAAGAGTTLAPALSLRGAWTTDQGLVARRIDGPLAPEASRRVRLVFRSASPRRALFQGLAAAVKTSLPNTVTPL